MSRPYDMELFLTGFLRGSQVTRTRHLRQAKAIQEAISKRWHRENPWTWQRKHLVWFLTQHVSHCAKTTRYYYLLTARLIANRLGKTWRFNALDEVQ